MKCDLKKSLQNDFFFHIFSLIILKYFLPFSTSMGVDLVIVGYRKQLLVFYIGLGPVHLKS